MWNEEADAVSEKERYQNTIFFPVGAPNDAYAQYFAGAEWLEPVSDEDYGKLR